MGPLIDFLSAGERESIRSLYADDLALAAAYYESEPAGPGRTRLGFIQEVVDDWIAGQKASPIDRPVCPISTPLTELLDRLSEQDVPTLSRSDTEILLALDAIVERLGAAVRGDYGAVRKYVDAIRVRRAELAMEPHLSGASLNLEYVNETQIEHAQVQAITSFAGVERDHTGPTYRRQGNLRVLGDIADDNVVVSEGGSCWVSGYVFGLFAATHHCDIGGNAGGTVITRTGHIRAVKALPKAFLVSKMGNVWLTSAEDPNLVYAGEGIEISRDVHGGRFMAPHLHVGGTVTSGELDVSESLEAAHLESSEMRPLTIALRDRITSQEYGEIVRPEARRLLAQGYREQARLDSVTRMIALAEKEIEGFAANAVFSLFGGHTIQKRVEEMDAAERRLAFIDRILEGLQAWIDTATSLGDTGGEEVDREGAPAEFGDIESELDELEATGTITPELRSARREIKQMGARVRLVKADTSLTTRLVEDAKAKRETWLERREELVRETTERRDEIGALMEKMDVLKHADLGDSHIAILERFYKMCRERPASDPLVVQAYSNFNKLMLQYMEQRRDRIRHYEAQRVRVRAAIDRIVQKLYEDHLMENPFRDAGPGNAYVRGRFGNGVTLCTDRQLLRENRVPPGSVLAIRDSGAGERVFELKSGRISERR